MSKEKQFYRASEVKDKVTSKRHETFKRGTLSGFHTLDEIISFKPKSTTLIFSHPHVGKSVLTLDVLTSIAEREPDAKIACFSPEFRTREELIMAVIQQKIGKTMYGEYAQEISDGEFLESIDWVDKFFIFLERPKKTKEVSTTGLTITDIFRLCREAEQEYGVKITMLYVDPMNYIFRSKEEEKMAIQDYVLYLHDTTAEFSIALDVHTIIVAHCRDVEMLTDKETGVKYYDIPYASEVMGGQSNYRGANQMIALWKVPSGMIDKSTGMPYPDDAIDVICRKAKPMGSGKLGTRRLYFNKSTHKLEEEIGGVRYSANQYYKVLNPIAEATPSALQPSKTYTDIF